MLPTLSTKTKILIVTLFITNILTGYFLITNNKNKQTQASKYPLVDPMRSLIEQKHFFSTIEPLRQELIKIADDAQKEGIRVGLYYEYLNTGSNVSINQDERFWPASLSKMPTAIATMKKVQNNEWKLTNELVLFEEDKDERFGELYKKPTGTRFTIEELLKNILINSDNTAHKILVRNLSNDEYTNIFEALGMEELFDKNYNITAKEYSRIFKSLYSASFLDREHSQILLEWLSESNFGEYLESGLPEEIKFSHKIGIEDKEEVFLDSGIVYIPNRPYLITVMIDVKKNGNEEKAKEVMTKVSKAAYEFATKN